MDLFGVSSGGFRLPKTLPPFFIIQNLFTLSPNDSLLELQTQYFLFFSGLHNRFVTVFCSQTLAQSTTWDAHHPCRFKFFHFHAVFLATSRFANPHPPQEFAPRSATGQYLTNWLGRKYFFLSYNPVSCKALRMLHA